MKTMNMVDEAVKIAGAPLVRFLRTGDNFSLLENEGAMIERAGALDEPPAALENRIAAPVDAGSSGCWTAQPAHVIDGSGQVVRLPAFALREASVESPRLDLVQGYLLREGREEEALEDFVFIVLWLGSLVAVAYLVAL